MKAEDHQQSMVETGLLMLACGCSANAVVDSSVLDSRVAHGEPVLADPARAIRRQAVVLNLRACIGRIPLGPASTKPRYVSGCWPGQVVPAGDARLYHRQSPVAAAQAALVLGVSPQSCRPPSTHSIFMPCSVVVHRAWMVPFLPSRRLKVRQVKSQG